MEILVAGASGFVGCPLTGALADAGHTVRAMTRNPDRYDGPGRAVFGDTDDPESLAEPMNGVDVAYYLVHSLHRDDFERADADSAQAFGAAAKAAGVTRIVYLGGLGADDESELSPHLRSRRATERDLAAAGVPVVTLRAAIIVGRGGTSWEITRQLVKNLPVMVTPRWVDTRTQPIALDDVVRYLVAAATLDAPEGAVYEVGGPEVLTYAEMLQRSSSAMGKRPPVIVRVPLLTPSLSSLWISLVTDVDATTARNLIDSMSTEVVVGSQPITSVVDGEPMSYEQAVRLALADQE